MDPQLKRTVIVVGAVAGVLFGWRQYSLYQMHKGYMGVAECVEYERRWGALQDRDKLKAPLLFPALKESRDPFADMNSDQLELIAFRYCSSEKGWKSWLDYRKATAPADDRPEM